MPRYSHLLFDLDDTLLDFKEASARAFDQFYDRYLSSMEITRHTAFEHYHDANMMVWEMFEQGQISIEELKLKRFEWMYQHAGLPVPHDDLIHQSSFYLEALIQSTSLHEGAEALLKDLSRRFHLSVITNGISYVQLSRLNRLNIRHYFQHLFISEEIGHSKPSSDFFNHVLHTLQPDHTGHVLVIGDSLKADIAGALKSGLDACWYNPSSLINESGLMPRFEIKNWQELNDVIS